ncbi:MAG: hypothetical protein H6712_26190 [Myxococcales bacterium]|nr:hypothetical protein [Myxococcales bacterium]
MPRRDIAGVSWAGAALAGALGLAACGGELATPWVPPDAAMVRCTTAGRDRMPPVLLELPVPPIPTGLLVRQLDPMALNDMGYEREQPVCAALLRPSDAEVEGARDSITALLTAYRETGTTVSSSLGACACDVARAADVVDLVAPCLDEPHRPACDPSPSQIERARELVEPLRETLAATPVPRLHWRVAGRSDRPGWIARRLPELLPRHAGGVTVYLAGQAVPSRHNHVLVRRLLDAPGVSAVLRLDGGRAMLVIRELDGALVLDLFSLPAVDGRLVPLLPFIDEAGAEDLAARLARPAAAWSPPLPLTEGNLVHLDRPALRAVDTLMLGLAPLAGLPDAPRTLPSDAVPLVDAVTLQARFGTEGKVLRARLGLSDAGQQWAQSLPAELLAPGVDQLGLPLELPPAPPPAVVELPFVIHRSATEWLVLDGISGAAAFMRRLEMQHPGALAGTLDAWELALPPGAIAPGGTVPPAQPLREWAERIGAERYQLRSSFDPARTTLELVLEPG